MAQTAKLQQVPVNKLVPYERNAKTHSAEQVEKIKASIEEFGFVSPILIDGEYNIIAGHGRVLAAKELGMDKVPAVFVEGLTEAQRRAYIIADNKLTELGGWDMEMVRAELQELDGEGFDTDITGFELEAITVTEDMGSDYEEVPGDDYEEVPARVRRGEIWQLGEHRLMCGDSTNRDDVIALMGGATADLLVTDPPYNVDYTGGTKDAMKIMNDNLNTSEFVDFLTAAFMAAAEVMKEGAAFYCWHSSKTACEFQTALQDAGLLPHECLIWVKNQFVIGRQDYQWRHEPCFYGWKEGAGHYFIDARTLTTVMDPTEDMTKEQLLQIVKDLTSITTTIYEDKPVRSEAHPTMKPLGLFKKLIRNSSRKRENVLDIFCGSGTTILAAEEMGRRAFGMELDPHFCDVIIERWEQATGGKAVKVDV